MKPEEYIEARKQLDQLGMLLAASVASHDAAEGYQYNIGDATMNNLFTPYGIKNLSNMQALFDVLEMVFKSHEKWRADDKEKIAELEKLIVQLKGDGAALGEALAAMSDNVIPRTPAMVHGSLSEEDAATLYEQSKWKSGFINMLIQPGVLVDAFQAGIDWANAHPPGSQPLLSVPKKGQVYEYRRRNGRDIADEEGRNRYTVGMRYVVELSNETCFATTQDLQDTAVWLLGENNDLELFHKHFVLVSQQDKKG